MAYLGLFTILFTSCIMGSLASSDLITKNDDEGRFLFGTGTATTGTGSSTDLTVTGWETTLVVGVLFLIVLIIWLFLLFSPAAEVATTAYAATAYETDPYAAQYAPTAFQSPHHAAPTGHHAAATGDHHSSYSVVRSLEAAARKYL